MIEGTACALQMAQRRRALDLTDSTVTVEGRPRTWFEFAMRYALGKGLPDRKAVDLAEECQPSQGMTAAEAVSRLEKACRYWLDKRDGEQAARLAELQELEAYWL